MEYENIDKATQYQEACKKIKQIADAIKQIRMKYYPNFGKISEQDKKVYEELNIQIERIASENGLDRLKSELIRDINDRYDMQENTQELTDEQLLKSYYGAIDAEKQALSEGKLKKALTCQQQANKYMEELQIKGTESFKQNALDYKRGRFQELVPSKTQVTADWEKIMRGYYREEDVQTRDDMTKEIAKIAKEREQPIIQSTNEMILE